MSLVRGLLARPAVVGERRGCRMSASAERGGSVRGSAPARTQRSQAFAALSTHLLMSDLWMWGITPPPAMVALMSVSSSSSPRMASWRWRGVMRFTLRSLEALPASSSTSAVRYSRIAAVYTAEVAPMRPVEVALFLRKRWIRPTGNWRPAFAEREIGFFLSPVCARENEQSSAGRRRAERKGARETQRVRTDASAAAQAHAWRRRCPCFAARRSPAPSRRIFERGRAARCAVLRAAQRRRGARRGAPPPTHLALAALAALATLARHDEECVCVLCTLCGPLRRACSWSSACGAVRHARVALAPALCRFAARETRRRAARARPARYEPAAMRARPPRVSAKRRYPGPPTPRARRVFQFFARARPRANKNSGVARARRARNRGANACVRTRRPRGSAERKRRSARPARARRIPIETHAAGRVEPPLS